MSIKNKQMNPYKYYDMRGIKTAHLHAASRAVSPVWLLECETNLREKCVILQELEFPLKHSLRQFCKF